MAPVRDDVVGIEVKIDVHNGDILVSKRFIDCLWSRTSALLSLEMDDVMTVINRDVGVIEQDCINSSYITVLHNGTLYNVSKGFLTDKFFKILDEK